MMIGNPRERREERTDLSVDTSITGAAASRKQASCPKKSPAVGQNAATLELATDVGQVAFVFCC